MHYTVFNSVRPASNIFLSLLPSADIKATDNYDSNIWPYIQHLIVCFVFEVHVFVMTVYVYRKMLTFLKLTCLCNELTKTVVKIIGSLKCCNLYANCAYKYEQFLF